MPLLGDAGHREMVSCLQNIAAMIPRPEALVVVSAHWEESLPSITSGISPPLIYDYYGFPEESYSISYPCAGEPALASRIYSLLLDAGIQSTLDEQRGFDHGLFVPLKIMYPEANIPCVQLSLVNTLEPSLHIEIGRALSTLSDDNILVIGSGFSFHNMQAFFRQDTPEHVALNHSFEQWLLQLCSDSALTEADRTQKLVQWADTRGARYCHPREEHLLPLHVCYGVSQSPCTEKFELKIMNKKSSMYLW